MRPPSICPWTADASGAGGFNRVSRSVTSTLAEICFEDFVSYVPTFGYCGGELSFGFFYDKDTPDIDRTVQFEERSPADKSATLEHDLPYESNQDGRIVPRVVAPSVVDGNSSGRQFVVRGRFCKQTTQRNEAYADQVFEPVNQPDDPFVSDDLRLGEHHLIFGDWTYHGEDLSKRSTLTTTI